MVAQRVSLGNPKTKELETPGPPDMFFGRPITIFGIAASCVHP
jgi:hypothetical protein